MSKAGRDYAIAAIDNTDSLVPERVRLHLPQLGAMKLIHRWEIHRSPRNWGSKLLLPSWSICICTRLRKPTR